MSRRSGVHTTAILALFTASLAGVPVCSHAAPADVRVKFLTYNVQSPGWNRGRRAQVVGVIETESPDVLGLHEATPGINGAELMEDLERDYEAHHAETRDPIYLRRDRSFELVDEGVEALPRCPNQRSSSVLTWVKVETPEGVRFDFYNTHFCVTRVPGIGEAGPAGNQRQAVATMEFMHANTAMGTVHLLAGDLNAGRNTPTIRYLLEGGSLEIGGARFENPIELDDTWELASANAGGVKPGTGARGGPTVLDWIMVTPVGDIPIDDVPIDDIPVDDIPVFNIDVIDARVIRFEIPPGEEGNFSDHLPVTATLQFSSPPIESTPRFKRGDCDGDGAFNLSDAIFLFSHLFQGGAVPTCLAACETNGDGVLVLADGIFFLSHLFRGGAAPPDPYPECERSSAPSDLDLGCAREPLDCP